MPQYHNLLFLFQSSGFEQSRQVERSEIPLQLSGVRILSSGNGISHYLILLAMFSGRTNYNRVAACCGSPFLMAANILINEVFLPGK